MINSRLYLNVLLSAVNNPTYYSTLHLYFFKHLQLSIVVLRISHDPIILLIHMIEVTNKTIKSQHHPCFCQYHQFSYRVSLAKDQPTLQNMSQLVHEFYESTLTAIQFLFDQIHSITTEYL